MKNLEDKVIANEPVSPAYWVEAAIRVNALVDSLDRSICLLEASMLEIEAEYVKDDYPASKAKILAKSRVDYKRYLELKAQREKIDQFIMLAKKRAEIRDI